MSKNKFTGANGAQSNKVDVAPQAVAQTANVNVDAVNADTTETAETTETQKADATGVTQAENTVIEVVGVQNVDITTGAQNENTGTQNENTGTQNENTEAADSVNETAQWLMKDQGVKKIFHNPKLDHWYTDELYAKDACKDYVTYLKQ